MMNNYNNFIQAIHEKRCIELTFTTKEKGVVTRKCIPFDFAPSSRAKDKTNRYQVYDLNSPDGSHNLAKLPGEVISIEILNETFNPADYVTWKKIDWHIKRDWGIYS